ncbi:hypothetical protein Tco_1528385 [Tanacetum coccineum]
MLKTFSFHITGPSKVHFNSCKDVALSLKSQLKTNGANPPDEGAMMLVEGDSPVECDLLHTNPIQNVAAKDEGLGEININGKNIDLLYLARDASDDVEANLNKTTEGMVKEAEFMGGFKGSRRGMKQ